MLQAAESAYSMSNSRCGGGRAAAIFTGPPQRSHTRLWRSLKYEDIYLKDYESVAALVDGVDTYFAFYNWERPHQSFDYNMPAQIYHQFNQTQAVAG